MAAKNTKEAKAKTGRPSKYTAACDAQAAKLCKLGATDFDLADFFGVTERTLYRWKLEHPSFCQALKRAKDDADALVEQSLFRKAVGYSIESEKVFQFQGQIIRAPFVEYFGPDTTAMIFWLKNRQPDNWRDKREGADDGDNTAQPVKVEVTVRSARKQDANAE